MARIGFVVHTGREAARLLAKETAEWLHSGGHGADVVAAAAPGDPRRTGGDAGRWDLAVSLGGDGTLLRAVDLVVGDDIPVLGVNMGHLGYLTAVEPGRLREGLTRFLAGEHNIEARMTLDVTVDGEGPGALHLRALNDVVFQRTAVGHTMHTEVAVNSVPFLNFASDSLILATPTGSTAYNLSARGPIVSPRARVQILTPVAPHMLFDRPLVLDAEESVTITAAGEQPVDVVVDGRHAAIIGPGQSVHAQKGRHDALLVTFEERDFHRILKSKFNLTDR